MPTTARYADLGGKVRNRLIAVGVVLIGRAAHADWTVVSLHPANAVRSLALSAKDGHQVGWAYMNDSWRAIMWSGTATNYVNLTPPGTYALGFGGGAGQQVGYVAGIQHIGAAVWSGTAGSWIDLHPTASGSTSSQAYDTDGTHQVGFAVFDAIYPNRASLWFGSAASWTSLQPAGASQSWAYATEGGQQVGEVDFASVTHAALWTGSAASYVDLTPAGGGIARGVQGGIQVGQAYTPVWHASLWRGTAASRVDLNPAVAAQSSAWAVHDGQEVGEVSLASGSSHAAFWTGSAASFVDLHQFLPARFYRSYARGIWHDAGYTYVVGYATDQATGENQAIMWVERTCGSADFNHDGDMGTDADIEAYFSCLSGLCCPMCGSADFNADGDVGTDADIEAFFRVLGGQPC